MSGTADEGAKPVGVALSIVFPAHNEQDNIEQAIDEATAVARRLCIEHEIIIVDDGSVDRTPEIVRKRSEVDPAIRLICHPENLGYGEAVRTGLSNARLGLVFFTDSDNQFDLGELERFLPWIDRVDVVAGYRLKRQDPVGRRAIALVWNALVRALYYVPVRDIDCAFKLLHRQLLEDLDLQAMGAMVNTELMVKLARSGCSVIEIGVHHYPRVAGKSRGANPRVILTAGKELVRMHSRLKTWHPNTSVEMRHRRRLGE